MQHLGILDGGYTCLARKPLCPRLPVDSVECRAPGAWHCVRAESVTLPNIRVLVAVNSVHEQVMTRRNAAVNRRRGHGAKASHEWAKKGE